MSNNKQHYVLFQMFNSYITDLLYNAMLTNWIKQDIGTSVNQSPYIEFSTATGRTYLLLWTYSSRFQKLTIQIMYRFAL